MRPIKDCLLRLLADTRGATAVEYGLIAALIFMAIVGGVTSMAEANNDTYETIETAVTSVV